ncbi:hypothetical protein Q4610_11350 [Sphingobium sp. HBC34]|uniref:Uncharacterized protein n=1 Tax=Sphingobium cyanobacteriorum TaxID=3063954 RepID=A0ABT8ZM85_9SPHN|nr:hypothetical protein [Sphingobium sp. HBC34]MDO7835640.1 hypothetical protein [Sphingobium sp. HBC34]
MPDIAFHADPAIKVDAQARLRGHIDAKRFIFYPAWEDGAANVIGAIIQSGDQQAYADHLGYPIALVTALDSIVNAYSTTPLAAEYAQSWLDRTPVGADLSDIVSQAIIFLLERPELVAHARGHAGIETARQAILALHRRALQGDAPERKAWKVVRLAAVTASDQAKDPLVRCAGTVVEAAAWPGTMRTVLHDVLGASGRLELKQLMQEIGWTDEEESQVFHIREQAEIDGRMAELSGLDRVLGLLDADNPQLAGRFRQRLDQFEKLGHVYRSAGAEILDLFSRAPVPVASR